MWLTNLSFIFQFEEFFGFSFFAFSLQAWLTRRPWACSLARGQMYSRHMGERGSPALPALSRNSHGSRESSHFCSRFPPSPSQPRPLLRTSWGHASRATYSDCCTAVSVIGDRRKMKSDSLKGQTQSHEVTTCPAVTHLCPNRPGKVYFLAHRETREWERVP